MRDMRAHMAVAQFLDAATTREQTSKPSTVPGGTSAQESFCFPVLQQGPDTTTYHDLNNLLWVAVSSPLSFESWCHGASRSFGEFDTNSCLGFESISDCIMHEVMQGMTRSPQAAMRFQVPSLGLTRC